MDNIGDILKKTLYFSTNFVDEYHMLVDILKVVRGN
jgi:hypothetical protein